MIEWIIRRSVANRFLVLMGALFLSIWGTGPSLIRQWMRCRISPMCRLLLKPAIPVRHHKSLKIR